VSFQASLVEERDLLMAQGPLGKIDHIGIAVKSIAEARKFYEGTLGATFLYEHANAEAGYTIVELDLNGFVIELLEPLGENSFLHDFLNRRGEGVHHLTLDVPNAKEKIGELKAAGVKLAQEREFAPDSHEAFISPKSSHGVLIQIGSGYPTLARAAEWFKK
jgi:methylmalonyl-CoA epimerase